MNLCLLYFCAFFAFNSKAALSVIAASPSGCSALFWYQNHPQMPDARAAVKSLIPSRHRRGRPIWVEDMNACVLPMIEYLRQCFTNEGHNTSYETPHEVFQVALADAVGGYLHQYLIPTTKLAYYAGNVRYDYARMLLNFRDEINTILGVPSDHWSKTSDLSRDQVCYKSMSLDLMEIIEDPCSLLITNDQVEGTRFQPGKNGLLPLPHLDNPDSPTAIAIPFRAGSVRLLTSPFETGLLDKYYVTSVQCLRARSCSSVTLDMFQRHLLQWINTAVIPHLDNDQWYPAFGGVLRLAHTLQLQQELHEEKWIHKILRIFYGFWQRNCDDERPPLVASSQQDVEANSRGTIESTAWYSLSGVLDKIKMFYHGEEILDSQESAEEVAAATQSKKSEVTAVYVCVCAVMLLVGLAHQYWKRRQKLQRRSKKFDKIRLHMLGSAAARHRSGDDVMGDSTTWKSEGIPLNMAGYDATQRLLSELGAGGPEHTFSMTTLHSGGSDASSDTDLCLSDDELLMKEMSELIDRTVA